MSYPLRGGGLGTTYDVHLGLIGKRIVDFLLVLIKLFLVRPMNALQLAADIFHTKKLCSTLFKQRAILDGNRSFGVFETPVGGLRGNVR